MLTAFIVRLLIGAAPATGAPAVTADAPVADIVRDETVTSARVAQVRLAEALGGADAIHAVIVKRGAITFAVTRGDQSLQLVARTNKRDEIVSLVITNVTSAGEGSLSWLGEELQSATAVTKLAPDEDGAVTIVTDDGRRYMVIPGRGSGGGNAAVEARWAAEWNR